MKDKRTALEMRKEYGVQIEAAKTFWDGVCALAEKEEREITDDENTALTEKREAAAALLELAEQREKADDASAWMQSAHDGLTESRGLPDYGTQPVRQENASVLPATINARHGTLRGFPGPNGPRDAYMAGRWVQGLAGDEASRNFSRQHGMDYRALSGGVNTKGGVLVPVVFENAVILFREERGVFRRETNVRTMTGDTLQVPRHIGNLTATPTAENADITESDPAWDMIELTSRSWKTLTKISNDLNEDATIDLANSMAQDIGYAFANAEDISGFLGDGTNTYHGIVGLNPGLADAAHTFSVINTGSGDLAFSDLTFGDFESVIGRLPQQAVANAKWYISRAGFYASMQRLLDAAGGNTIDTLSVGGRGVQFLGFPVVISQVLPSVLTDVANQMFCSLGDLRQASTFGDRRGVTIAISEHHFFNSDALAVRGVIRFDINVHELGSTSVAGAIVGLEAPGS